MFAFLVLGTIWLKSEWGGGGSEVEPTIQDRTERDESKQN